MVTCTLKPWLEALSDSLKVSRVSENIFLIISLHCMNVKIKENKLLRRSCPTFTTRIKWIHYRLFQTGDGKKKYEIRTTMKNGSGAMTTAKNVVFIGL